MKVVKRGVVEWIDGGLFVADWHIEGGNGTEFMEMIYGIALNKGIITTDFCDWDRIKRKGPSGP